jgi:hypothetical protein
VSKGRKPLAIDHENPRERALSKMKEGMGLKKAAKSERISAETLRRYLNENVKAKWQRRRWFIVDARPVPIAMCSKGKFRWVRVSQDQTTTVGQYWVAVNRFLESNDASHLAPFEGKGVRDHRGKYVPFETRPNVLRRLDSAGELSFPEIYKNVN